VLVSFQITKNKKNFNKNIYIRKIFNNIVRDMSSYKIQKSLDLTGTSCAGPIGELSGVMDEIGVGEAVEVILGDEATKKDVVAWVTKKGYKVVSETKEGNKFKLIIQK